MSVIYYLLPLALALGSIGLLAFMWTLKSGQYDDMDGTAWRAIMDDDEDLIPHKSRASEQQSPQETVNKSENSG